MAASRPRALSFRMQSALCRALQEKTADVPGPAMLHDLSVALIHPKCEERLSLHGP